ncbi:hypothetical protein [Methylococcus geothermalis]|uniref:Lipoprotein n=1 Tax=Methylococcus geothermalis TaxID=2681310 RepID=A0A858QAQ5_9GAMM|nr:hypothetical protein [Methylococcus geothermalis]QJD31022.1 hypothetical protein GNH96_14425 [Methylococcus geothermalis]
MLKNFHLLPLAVALLAGCSHDIGLMRQDETLTGYESAIRWGLWEKAAGYQARRPRPEQRLDRLKGFKVTGYQVRYRRSEEPSALLFQTVEIRYLRPDELTERSMVEEEMWRYDNDKERWMLETDLPELK